MLTEKQLLDLLFRTVAIGGAIGVESQRHKPTQDQLIVGLAGAALAGYFAYKIGQRLVENQNQHISLATTHLKSIPQRLR